MEAISIGSDPHLYFQVGKIKISEGMKCLKDLVEWCKDDLTPESAGRVDEIMAYLQSLQQEIESLAQQRVVHVSSNVNGTDLQPGQETTQIREQNAYFGPTLNQEIEMVMNPDVGNTSSAKRRKLKSKVWEDFTKYEGIDGKEWAKCKHCKKDFVGSSKSGTTHLKNHLKSCSGLKNLDGGAEKAKEESVIDPELNGYDLVIKIIKYGLNSLKNDILDVYKQEKDKLHRYLHKLPSRFNVTIRKVSGLWFLTIWFIDDSWELKKMISLLGRDKDEDEDEDEEYQVDALESAKSFLVDWNIDKKICCMVRDGYYDDGSWKIIENVNNWLNERGSLSFFGNCQLIFHLLNRFLGKLCIYNTKLITSVIATKALVLWDYVTKSSNVNKFQHAVEKTLSMGNTVTSRSVPSYRWFNDGMVEWVMGCKEAFCELENIDPDFKSINFIKEDWDELTLLYNGWKGVKELQDWGQDVKNKFFDPKYNTANVYFPIICQIFSKLVQLEKSNNHYICDSAEYFREDFDEFFWNDFKMVLIITVILDPRYKMDIVKHLYEEIYDDPVYLKKIIDEVTNIYNKYAEDTNNDIATSKSELDHYLRDSKCPSTEVFDLLEWWRVNSPIYPTLTQMARDFLSIPVNSPIFEISDSLFLLEIKDIYRCSNLDNDLKQALACTKVWLNFPVIK